MDSKEWRKLRRTILKRDNYLCFYCGREVEFYVPQDDKESTPGHIDHMHPVSLGGSNDPDNLVTACRACNCSKGDADLEAYRNRISMQKDPLRAALTDIRNADLMLIDAGYGDFSNVFDEINSWLRGKIKPFLFPGERK